MPAPSEIPASRKVIPTSLYIDEETLKLADELAEEMGTSRSALFREAIRRMREDERGNEIRSLVTRLFKVVTGT